MIRDLAILEQMKHSPVRNYVVPGLTSWLIGEPSKDRGTVRLFECSREQQEAIVPHSHRFDFECLVLEGQVVNRVWRETVREKGDHYSVSVLKYQNGIGSYDKSHLKLGYYSYEDTTFKANERYGMKANEIHSILFSRGTRVLFFEGPTLETESVVLEPYVYKQEVIPTLEVKPWMFRRT